MFKRDSRDLHQHLQLVLFQHFLLAGPALKAVVVSGRLGSEFSSALTKACILQSKTDFRHLPTDCRAF